MKFIYALIMCAALAGLAFSLFAGMAYHFDGYGLHPALAGLCGALSAFAGWEAAGKLGSE